MVDAHFYPQSTVAESVSGTQKPGYAGCWSSSEHAFARLHVLVLDRGYDSSPRPSDEAQREDMGRTISGGGKRLCELSPGLYCLDLINLTQMRVTWEAGTSIEKLPPSD